MPQQRRPLDLNSCIPAQESHQTGLCLLPRDTTSMVSGTSPAHPLQFGKAVQGITWISQCSMRTHVQFNSSFSASISSLKVSQRVPPVHAPKQVWLSQHSTQRVLCHGFKSDPQKHFKIHIRYKTISIVDKGNTHHKLLMGSSWILHKIKTQSYF